MHHCSLHSIGCGVTPGGLEILFFDMHDMYRPSQNILKVREFKKCLTVRDFLQYLLSVKNKRSFSSICTLERNAKWHDFFVDL
jgi:hypothetical protein